ncbi:hypothetical protein H6P81_004221 [Aristolochia fimbriata]|uniref:Uncharacterized protein n=1 Tax=Aristolochia fimbriata TaxID=158543 RepID=A0AAV7FEY9_ARIFI|nr:hypothetical protein H6P81_004221 [Aristolochia fimbriata]
MPKERRARSVSFDRFRVSPFPCSSSSNCSKQQSSSKSSKSAEEIKEWEEARCPVCMEHPHNAVLLLCSSHDKGCRPFMCDTSYRHSNCLDQYCKAFSAESPPSIQELSSSSNDFTDPSNQEVHQMPQGQLLGEQQNQGPQSPCSGLEKAKLSCPLCRGTINGWIVVEAARQFMNGKTRSCSCESCPFNGTYPDLRKHARQEHPLARPSEVDQQRQRDWRRLERQRDLGDVLSTIQSALGDERGGIDEASPFPVVGDEGVLTFYFLFRVSSSNWSSVPSRVRASPVIILFEAVPVWLLSFVSKRYGTGRCGSASSPSANQVLNKLCDIIYTLLYGKSIENSLIMGSLHCL